MAINKFQNYNLPDAGVQPIHLACLNEDYNKIWYLVKSDADLEVVLSKKNFLKYSKNAEWSDEFGDEITMLTYAVINNKAHLAKILIDYRANFTIKTTSNKTLLMYALEHSSYEIAEAIMLKLTIYPQEVNARDDDNWHAFHYLIYKTKDKPRIEEKWSPERYEVLQLLHRSGADLYATINGDPDTMLLNMITSLYNSSAVLRYLLPRYLSIAQSRALSNITLPYHTFDNNSNERNQTEEIKRRLPGIKLIISDLIHRNTFRLYVPEEEKIVMNNLIAVDEDIRKFVESYKQYVTEELINKEIPTIENEKMTIFQLFNNGLSDETFDKFIKRKNSIHDTRLFLTSVGNQPFYMNFSEWSIVRLMLIVKKNKKKRLIKRLQKVPLLRKFIPLPYELVLEIVEYLLYDDLRALIKAFYTR